MLKMTRRLVAKMLLRSDPVEQACGLLYTLPTIFSPLACRRQFSAESFVSSSGALHCNGATVVSTNAIAHTYTKTEFDGSIQGRGYFIRGSDSGNLSGDALLERCCAAHHSRWHA